MDDVSTTDPEPGLSPSGVDLTRFPEALRQLPWEPATPQTFFQFDEWMLLFIQARGEQAPRVMTVSADPWNALSAEPVGVNRSRLIRTPLIEIIGVLRIGRTAELRALKPEPAKPAAKPVTGG